MNDVAAMLAEALRLSGLIDQALNELRTAGRDTANAEAVYRKARATAWVTAPRDALAKEREAWVDAKCADQRMARDLADASRQVWLEAVRSRRTQVSVLQSMANAHREEAALARSGVAA